jgi:hypothetical protein
MVLFVINTSSFTTLEDFDEVLFGKPEDNELRILNDQKENNSLILAEGQERRRILIRRMMLLFLILTVCFSLKMVMLPCLACEKNPAMKQRVKKYIQEHYLFNPRRDAEVRKMTKETKIVLWIAGIGGILLIACLSYPYWAPGVRFCLVFPMAIPAIAQRVAEMGESQIEDLLTKYYIYNRIYQFTETTTINEFLILYWGMQNNLAFMLKYKIGLTQYMALQKAANVAARAATLRTGI